MDKRRLVTMKINENFEKDFVVIGGGLAGICAAISAARYGLKVALCQDKSVLGGNSSSECRVWICGATGIGNNRYAEETGIINEITLENLYRNPEGNPYIWDALLLEFVLAEPNIQLFLNTRAIGVNMNSKRIDSIICYQSSTEKTYSFHSPLFADCTGDGQIAFLAGARTVYGTEDLSEEERTYFDLEEGKYSLGSTMLFYYKTSDKPVKYIPPKYAFTKEQIQKFLDDTNKEIELGNGCDYWWLEYGGELDTINDNEEIASVLRKLVFGVWDYIKNSGKYDAEYLTLEWVASWPGKRESRRVIAEKTMKAEDILSQVEQSDTVCHGGWPIDTHPKSGFFDKRDSCSQIPVNVYDIPFSSLCCKDVKNLLLAGRNAGFNHVAMASARVMKTCAVMGQAIGTAAALLKEKGLMPHRMTCNEINELQQRLLKDDVWIIGRKNTDSRDLARSASITGSEGAVFGTGNPSDFISLKEKAFIILPPIPSKTTLQIMLKSNSEQVVKLSLYDSIKPQNYTPERLCVMNTVTLTSGEQCVSISHNEDTIGNTIMCIEASDAVMIGTVSQETLGIIGVFSNNGRGFDLFNPAIKTIEPVHLFEPINVIDGYNRPYGGMHLWASPISEEKPFVELKLAKPERIGVLHLYLECSLYRDFNNLRPGKTNPEWDKLPPYLARKIRIEFIGGNTVKVINIDENRQRHVIVRTDCANVERIRVTIENTWGGELGVIHEIRVYRGDFVE